MGSGNVAPAPVSATPPEPPPEFFLLPQAAASSTMAITTATAPVERVSLGMQPPCLVIRGRSSGGVSRLKRGARAASNPLPGKPPTWVAARANGFVDVHASDASQRR